MDLRHDKQNESMARRVAALERLLVERGCLTEDRIDDIVDLYQVRLGAHNGARYVARAWSDAEFRAALLEDGTGVIRAHGYDLAGGRHAELPFLRLVVLQNTTTVHNVVVCTLCSCYPVGLLGPPPRWYKSHEYRARTVRDPRRVLAEFGVRVLAETQVRVWDSTADVRYLVLPLRPAGTEGWSEAELARLVTRDSMIGTGHPREPAVVRSGADRA